MWSRLNERQIEGLQADDNITYRYCLVHVQVALQSLTSPDCGYNDVCLVDIGAGSGPMALGQSIETGHFVWGKLGLYN